MTLHNKFDTPEEDLKKLEKFMVWLDEECNLSDEQVKYLSSELQYTELVFGETTLEKTSPTYIEPLNCVEREFKKKDKLKKTKPKHSQPFWTNDWRRR